MKNKNSVDNTFPVHNAPLSMEAVIKTLYQYFADGAFDQMEQLFHPDAVWIQMEGFPGGGIYTGRQAILAKVFGSLKKDWQDWKASVQSIVEAQNSVFVIGQYSGRYVRTGKAFEADFAHHYQFRDERIIRFKQYTDTARIVAATIK